MIDLLAIMLVTGACLYVTIRAMMLDRMLPWFTAHAPEPEQEAPALPVQDAAPIAASGGWRSRTARPRPRSGRQMDH